MKTFNANGKNPNELHDYLIANDCAPLYLGNNAVYGDDGEIVQEATEIYIMVEEGKEDKLTQLVDQFMSK